MPLYIENRASLMFYKLAPEVLALRFNLITEILKKSSPDTKGAVISDLQELSIRLDTPIEQIIDALQVSFGCLHM